MDITLYDTKTLLHYKLLRVLDLQKDNTTKKGLFPMQINKDNFYKVIEQKQTSDNAYLYDDYGIALGYNVLEIDMATKPVQQFSYFPHIKLGLLLEILNSSLPKYENSRPVFKFNTQRDLHQFKTLEDHISVDPGVCIIPHLRKKVQSKNSFRIFTNNILDIFVSIDHILLTLDSVISSNQEVDLLTFMDRLLLEIQDCMGGINQFELQYYEEDAEFSIVDRNNLGFNLTYPEISIAGTNTIVKEFRLVSKLTPQITTAIAVSAQASPFASGTEATGFRYINKGLIDGIIKTTAPADINSIREQASAINVLPGAAVASNASKATRKQQLELARQKLTNDIRNMTAMLYLAKTTNNKFNVKYSKETTQYLKILFNNYYKILLGLEEDPHFSFIIPFELQITLDGISGLRVMESFKIKEDILPYPYRSKEDGTSIAYLITGIEHSVSSSGGWITKIKAQIFTVKNKKEEKVASDFIEENDNITIRPTPPTPAPTPTPTPQPPISGSGPCADEQIGFFKISEFNSPDGTPMSPSVCSNIKKVISNLNVLRAELGSPITVTSGFRSAAYNATIKTAAKNSQHILGNAADIVVPGFTPREVADTIKRLKAQGLMERGGLKAYNNFVHYDRRGVDVTW